MRPSGLFLLSRAIIEMDHVDSIVRCPHKFLILRQLWLDECWRALDEYKSDVHFETSNHAAEAAIR